MLYSLMESSSLAVIKRSSVRQKSMELIRDESYKSSKQLVGTLHP